MCDAVGDGSEMSNDGRGDGRGAAVVLFLDASRPFPTCAITHMHTRVRTRTRTHICTRAHTHLILYTVAGEVVNLQGRSYTVRDTSLHAKGSVAKHGDHLQNRPLGDG